MRIPLLVHYQPKIGQGPTVMLEEGDWKIESNHIDSELRIALDSDLCTLNPPRILLDHDTRVTINITKVGTEKHITIYAVKIKNGSTTAGSP